ncbi:unnamed protein product, partial [Fusarium fujikuroi]
MPSEVAKVNLIALACKLAFYVVSADSRHSKLAEDQFLCNMISVSMLKLGLILDCTQSPSADV